jgi:hypothetical protein
MRSAHKAIVSREAADDKKLQISSHRLACCSLIHLPISAGKAIA